VRFTYNNPSGGFGLPAGSGVRVSLNELHIVGLCQGKVFRQYSQADLVGLRGQLTTALGK
jgi:hypothetical protein